jgi:serine/threonine protein kinase
MDQLPHRVPRAELPMLTRFSEMKANEFTEITRLTKNVRVVVSSRRKYILKKHVTSFEDLLYRKELEAYVLHDLTSPHIVEFVGYTVDAEDKVDAMVLNFSPNYDIRWYIQEHQPDDWKLKYKWVAQIVHGLMAIHKVGITHGDLRCENVVLDEKLNARIIDVVQGQGIMEGWCPWKYPEMEAVHEPSWDIYSLGASIWEILSNGATPPENQVLQFDFSLPEDDGVQLLKEIAECCLVDNPKERPTAGVLKELGGADVCGCTKE